MDPEQPRRTLVVANRTASTALLLEEVRRRAIERPTTFTLLIPNVESKKTADWTLEEALKSLRRAARGPVDGIVGGKDAFESIHKALTDGAYDEVLISTLSKRRSEWLRRDLPRRVEKLGVPVIVITEREREDPMSERMRAMGDLGPWTPTGRPRP